MKRLDQFLHIRIAENKLQQHQVWLVKADNSSVDIILYYIISDRSRRWCKQFRDSQLEATEAIEHREGNWSRRRLLLDVGATDAHDKATGYSNGHLGHFLCLIC